MSKEYSKAIFKKYFDNGVFVNDFIQKVYSLVFKENISSLIFRYLQWGPAKNVFKIYHDFISSWK